MTFMNRCLHFIFGLAVWFCLVTALPVAMADEAVADGAVHAAHDSHATGLPSAAPILFEIGFFKVTNSMVAMLLVCLGLVVFAQLATRDIRMVPEGVQNFAEWLVEALSGFLGSIMGEKLAQKTLWYFISLFVFILAANWFGLLPGVGSIGWGTPDSAGHLHHLERPLLRGANADLNMTLALAIGFFGLWLFWSIRANGVGGFLSHIFGYHGDAQGGLRVLLIVTFFLVGFLEVISILLRPVVLNFRLFGNIFAGETLLETMLNFKMGFLVALPFYFLELMVGLIQALVFTLLAAVFTAQMCQHDEGHGESHEGAEHGNGNQQGHAGGQAAGNHG